MENLEGVSMVDEEKNGERGREGTGGPAVKYCWMCNILIVLAVAAMKLYYSRADSDALRWILAPTVRWVRILSGISFAYEPEIGYVNHTIRFIIASSCSGIQFMTILFAAVALSFVHRMGRPLGKALWIAGSAAASVVLTVFVNGFRIALSIFLPKVIFQTGGTGRMGALSGWLTPERLHTITGVVFYFTALLVIWRVAGSVADNIGGRDADNIGGRVADGNAGPGEKTLYGWIWPVSVYLLVVLVFPFLHGAFWKDPGPFGEFALLVAASCAVILGLIRGILFILRKL